jgi:glycogen debranching enzyme
VRERLFVPLGEPGAIISYDVSGARRVDIKVHFEPSLNLMWPAGLGGQSTDWVAALSGYLLYEPTGRFTATVSSPNLIAHDDTDNPALSLHSSYSLSMTLRAAPGEEVARVLLAAGTSPDDCAALAKKLLTDEASLESVSAQHYADVLEHNMRISTPDPDTNRALVWAQIALEQSWVCNPGQGCALVAGYGPSRMARRPRYDWFFSDDGMAAIPALLSLGQYERAREELEFVANYQDPRTGMIWHELSLGAGALNWRQYPYLYADVGASLQFLDVAALYVTTTGDLQFAHRHWKLLLKTYRYCISLLDAKDGLPRIPGDNEEDPDRGDSINVAVSWVKAAKAFAALASATHHNAEAARSRDIANEAGVALVRRYWDETQQRWISAHTRSGISSGNGELIPAGVLSTAPVSPVQRQVLLRTLVSPDFQTDWGTRSKAASASSYDASTYFSGSVWAHATAEVAADLWGQHWPASASSIWRTLVPWSTLDESGHMHEVMAGDVFHEEVESVPEQLFSSATFLASASSGLLGLVVDSGSQQLTIAPHLPADWSRVRVEHLRASGSDITFELQQSAQDVRVDLQNDGAPLKVHLDPQIPLGATLISATIGDLPIVATLEENPQDTHASVSFELLHGATSVRIRYRGGVALLPPTRSGAVGEPSRGLQMTGVSLAAHVLSVYVETTPEGDHSFLLRTPWRLTDARQDSFELIGEDLYRVVVHPPATGMAGATSYQPSAVILTFMGDN